ncbi:Asp-tRNA(Asn)/Glu-tRNA(Gln) amidotransferase GatCAB subunit C [Candidatus Beckwithbacteria bacterium CG23_combo_of_CG06-09_8_20_14_all_34_8]|uniref:Aspartyl/glutamyl-tRNA(Asn/Gln) amidotransferase subunit C n=1 Tax=Candidatus Beckwithbacteria bacterium CG23_combo_of_CG06-09_8_20_14_all_34_8 TaxID=1974497 RepID=A0A2H0B5Z9_9BACT|nr:MAG: Asp-tRNA(Asn)/Glu-tRNA(Gln) amidotransferase GatCAB subunit C [Candidatus Beckwithbacteria bacterium CG23_combo_of_CG06-09_8_20_14_all_34_8]
MSNSKLTADDISHIAKLANLQIKDSEVETFSSQLSSILDYVNDLQKVDTKGVEETSVVTGLKNVFAPNEIDSNRTLSQNEALSNTKHKIDGYFQVPAVIAKE